MIRQHPRSTRVRSSAASDVYKRQVLSCCCRFTIIIGKSRATQLPTKSLWCSLIRVSRTFPNSFLVLNHIPSVFSKLIGFLLWAIVDDPTSVSYTHLRAHETV